MNSRGKATDEEILADLRRVADELDTERLTRKEYAEADGLVSTRTVQRRFESWTSTVEQAGLKPGKPGRSVKATDEEILADLRRVADDRDTERLMIQDYADADADGLVSVQTVIRRFGSWAAALDEIDLEPGHRENVTDEEILADLRRVADDLDTKQLTVRDYDNADGIVSADTVSRRFGGWLSAIAKVGDVTDEPAESAGGNTDDGDVPDWLTE